MRADRLLSIVWLLRAHGRMTTAQLATRLEVSRRTVLRDVEALSEAGVPIYTERGTNGGIALLPGYRTDVSALNAEESKAIFAAISSWGAESLGLGEALASALRKLLAAVPDAYRNDSVDVSSRIIVDPEGWLPRPERERVGSTFRIVRDAVFGQYCLSIDFHEKNSPISRAAIAEPHGLVSAGTSWYLCATMNKEVRFLKLSRFDGVAPLPHRPVASDRNIEVASAWRDHRALFQGKFESLVVLAWVRDTRWSDIQEWTIRAERVPTTATMPTASGWSHYRLDFVDHLHAITILTRLGGDVYILSPMSLRDDVVLFAEEILRTYSPSDVA